MPTQRFYEYTSEVRFGLEPPPTSDRATSAAAGLDRRDEARDHVVEQRGRGNRRGRPLTVIE